MKPTGNPVVGNIKGPGKPGTLGVIQFQKSMKLKYIEVRMIGEGVLMLNGVLLNTLPCKGNMINPSISLVVYDINLLLIGPPA